MVGLLGRRVAAAEGGFFASRSREAIASLRKKQQDRVSKDDGCIAAADSNASDADVLPEILQHSMPLSVPESSAESGLWSEKSMPSPKIEPDYMTVAPRTWGFRSLEDHRQPSVANDLRARPQMTSSQAKLLVEGYFMVVKAFFVGTAIVLGGAVVGAKMIKSRLDIKSMDDIPARGREYFQPKVEGLRAMLEPARLKIHGLRQPRRVDPDLTTIASPKVENIQVKQ